MSLRYELSFKDDPDMRIKVTMTNLLILSNIGDTPWSDSKLVSVPGFPYYNNNPANLPTCLCNTSVRLFANKMKNMKLGISYDFAIAIVK